MPHLPPGAYGLSISALAMGVFWPLAMPFVSVTWVPKAARQNPAVRKAVAKAVIQALVGVQAAEVTPDKVVVRFAERQDNFALPEGHTHLNVDEPPPR